MIIFPGPPNHQRLPVAKPVNYFECGAQEGLEKGEGLMLEATFSFLLFLGPVCG